MPPSNLVSSFLSVKPLEPVLVFATPQDAAFFHSHCKQGRILSDQNPRWVFLPMPEGLERVRTAKYGDIAYEFETRRDAEKFKQSLDGLGKILAPTREKPNWDRTVYLGKPVVV